MKNFYTYELTYLSTYWLIFQGMKVNFSSYLSKIRILVLFNKRLKIFGNCLQKPIHCPEKFLKCIVQVFKNQKHGTTHAPGQSQELHNSKTFKNKLQLYQFMREEILTLSTNIRFCTMDTEKKNSRVLKTKT